MDPSALIFVALAVAWAAYLIPKALEHHEESTRTRSIDRFSDRIRILARREPSSRRRSALVTVADQAREPAPALTLTPEERVARLRAHRRASVAATKRRRRVLDLLVLAHFAVAGVAIWQLVDWVWMAAPAGATVLWLVVCRLARRGERRRYAALLAAPVGEPVRESVAVSIAEPAEPVADPLVEPPAAPPAAVPHQAGWEMLPFVVPTYVGKERVRRSVRTIDLESTGVWSSGRSDIDSALVRDSAAARAEQDDRDDRDDRAAPAG